MSVYKEKVGGRVASGSVPQASVAVVDPSEGRFCQYCRSRGRHDRAFGPACERAAFFRGVDPVTGFDRYSLRYCSEERRSIGLVDRLFGRDRCGPEGKYFAERVMPSPPTGGSAVGRRTR